MKAGKRSRGLMRGRAGVGALYAGAQPMMMPAPSVSNVTYAAQDDSVASGKPSSTPSLAEMQAQQLASNQAVNDEQKRQDQIAQDQATAAEVQSQQRSAAKKGLGEKIGSGVGTVLGAMVGGPLGAMLGGTLGDLAGLGISSLF